MSNIVGVAILALGVVLLIFGFNEAHSFNSDVSRFFTGNPTDRSMWVIVWRRRRGDCRTGPRHDRAQHD
jgi:hypothetical protein